MTNVLACGDEWRARRDLNSRARAPAGASEGTDTEPARAQASAVTQFAPRCRRTDQQGD